LVLSAAALRLWATVQATIEYADAQWPELERAQIREALDQLDAFHATVGVRERTGAASGRWERRRP
jgi:tRNA U34 5-carboxymethylaminomethyl modifying GTPase MnmE/TrmE